MKRHTARVTSKGQVTIPKPVRDRLGLGKGDLLLFEADGEAVMLRRASLAAATELERLTERIASGLEAWGLPRAEVQEALRWARAGNGAPPSVDLSPAQPGGATAVAASAPAAEPVAAEPEPFPVRQLQDEELEEVLRELRQRLGSIYGQRLSRLILYGSRARGDAGPTSDINVLIVLSGAVDPGAEIRRTSRPVAQLSLDRGVVISRIFLSESRFRRERSPLLLAVRREGVAL